MKEFDVNNPKENTVDYKKYIVDNKYINDNLYNFLDGKFKMGLGIGIESFDKYFLLKENQLWASTGKKGGGKTTITQINYLMWSIIHGVKFAVAYQENDDWHVKFNLLCQLLGVTKNELMNMRKKKDLLLIKALEWIDNHYYFLKVKTIKEACESAKGLINEGVKIHTLIIDPANSFLSGFSDTGNERKDHTITAIEVLNFAINMCSVHVSQHPIMSKQRSQEKVTSYDAENGVYLNKAHATYCINRDKGTSLNEIWLDNERTTHMGGGQTHPESPIIMHWRPDGIDLEIDGVHTKDVVQILRKRHNPLNEVFEDEQKFEEEKEIITASVSEAFGINEEEVPF